MSASFHLFERFGVELEYMIVDATSLDVLPVSDEVLRSVAGEYTSDVDRNGLSWSNELVLHVIELKTNGPVTTFDGLAAAFQHDVGEINALLKARNGRLMSGAAHPWMDPAREARLWPHEYNPVYESFNRIFNCKGHGWSNLQATHINLPFIGDEEFGRLHAAIRLVLPILPALAAASPILDGRPTGLCDTRLEYYRTNSRRIPSVTGSVIPEPVYSQAAYKRDILQRIYADLTPFDPEGILRYEWANARGAIARFDRGTIEIRVLDIQECPAADIAVLTLIVAVLRALAEERWLPLDRQQAAPTERLAALLRGGIQDAERAVIDDTAYLEQFGVSAKSMTAGELWRHLWETLFDGTTRESAAHAPLRVISQQGCLARRLLAATGTEPTRERLAEVYGELCDCVADGRMFAGQA